MEKAWFGNRNSWPVLLKIDYSSTVRYVVIPHSHEGQYCVAYLVIMLVRSSK